MYKIVRNCSQCSCPARPIGLLCNRCILKGKTGLITGHPRNALGKFDRIWSVQVLQQV